MSTLTAYRVGKIPTFIPIFYDVFTFRAFLYQFGKGRMVARWHRDSSGQAVIHDGGSFGAAS